MTVKPELFTIKPVHDGPAAAAVLSPDGKSVRVTVSAPPALEVSCKEGDWSFRYNDEIGVTDLLAHMDNHSEAHPGDGWMEPKPS